MTHTIYWLLFLFFIYAFLGWCAEVSYHAVTFGKFINRGFLNGPVCPIYGVGALVVLLCLQPVADNGVLLFLFSMVLTSMLEALTGFILEKLFHARWWDYSEEPFHIGPYVCLKFSLMWGFACVFILRLLHPFLLFLIGLIPPVVGTAVLILFSAVLTADLCATAATVTRIFRSLEALEGIGKEIHTLSDKLGEKITDSALDAAELQRESKEKLEAYKEQLGEKIESYKEQLDDRLEDYKEELDTKKAQLTTIWEELGEQADSLGERLEDQMLQLQVKLEEKQAELRFRLAQNPLSRRRIFKAFPNLRSLDHQEALEKLRAALNHKK